MNEKNEARFSLRLPRERLKRLKLLAKREECSTNHLLNIWIREKLNVEK